MTDDLSAWDDQGEFSEAEIDAILGEISDNVASGRLSDADLGELAASGGLQLIDGEPAMADLSFADAYDQLGGMIELAADRETQRVYEDAEPAERTAELKLANALDRVARGTYLPPPSYRYPADRPPLDFAPPAEAARTLASLRWSEPDPAALVTGRPLCGVADDLGRCGARYHDATCDQVVPPDDLPAARRQLRDVAQRQLPGWQNQYGLPYTLSQHIEASTGVKTSLGPWETGEGERDLFQPQRGARFADLDDPEDAGFELPQHIRDRASRIRQELGVFPKRDPVADRELARAQVTDARMTRRSQGYRDQPRETMRERAERMRARRGPSHLAALVQPEDGLAALPQFVAGGLL